MSQAQPTVLFKPQVPTPVPNKYKIQPIPHAAITAAIPKAIHHERLAFPTTDAITSSVI